MHAIADLSGQEYVHEYASDVKEKLAQGGAQPRADAGLPPPSLPSVRETKVRSG